MLYKDIRLINKFLKLEIYNDGQKILKCYI